MSDELDTPPVGSFDPQEHPNPCGGDVVKQLWHCGWPDSDGYPGAYPDRFLGYAREFLPVWEPVCHLFSGTVEEGVTVDLNPEVDADHQLDLTEEKLPHDDETFAVVLADPPYTHADYDAGERHYDMPEVPRYSFRDEAARVTKVGGFFGVLHVMPYRTPANCERWAMIGVTTGTTQVIRCFSVFRKTEASD